MKNNKSIYLIILFAITMINPAYAAVNPPHPIAGHCWNAIDGTPADGSTITVYIESRANEKLYTNVGAGGAQNEWITDISGFSTPWSIDEILIVEVDNMAGYFDRTALILKGGNWEETPDMTLKKQSDPGHIALIMGKITYTGTEDIVEDADVFIECLNNSEITDTTSDSSGYYYATLSCPVNTSVKVRATKDTESGNNTGIIEDIGTVGTTLDIGIALVDVSIPEFPIQILPALLSIATFGFMRMRT